MRRLEGGWLRHCYEWRYGGAGREQSRVDGVALTPLRSDQVEEGEFKWITRIGK